MWKLAEYKTKHGRKIDLWFSSAGDFWLVECDDIRKMTIYLDEATARKLANDILQKLGQIEGEV